ncbi:MAG: polyprenyl synthetase family protein [Acidimicrobiales bacterium]|nr:polyprenyl synthetase family protein [Acidimicrobiales bacterium]
MSAAGPLQLVPSLPGDLTRVEERLRDAVQAEDDLLTDVAGHLIAAGGKRVRPGFALASAGVATGGEDPAHEDVVMGAVAVELVHLGSLYHDDVMDEATTRRNVESVNARWGNLKAILAGDFLLARASEIAASLGTEIAGLLARTIGRLCEGQVCELQYAFDLHRTEAEYERAIGGKTASLLATSCRVGAIVGGLGRVDVETLTEFGHSYGMAFQVVDDILDVVATDDQLGKQGGKDLLEGIYTLPVIRALRTGAGERLGELLSGPLDADGLTEARQLIGESGAIDDALDVARAHADKAAAALSSLPDNPAADGLRAAADHLIARAATPLTEIR